MYVYIMSNYLKSINKYTRDKEQDDLEKYYEDNLCDAKFIENNLNYFESQEDNTKLLIKSGGLENFVYDPTMNSQNIIYDLESKQTQEIMILRNYDVLSKIYLEAEFDEFQTFNDLSLVDKYDLLNTKISLYIGNNLIHESNILAGIFCLISSGLNLKNDSNKIQFPIIDFTMMKTMKSFSDESIFYKIDFHNLRNLKEVTDLLLDDLNKKNFDSDNNKNLGLRDDEKGLFLVGLNYSAVKIQINFLNDNVFKNIKFKLIAQGKFLSSEKRNDVAFCAHENLFLCSQFKIANDIYTLQDKECGNFIKAIILYFIPTNTDYVEYPRIKFIRIRCNWTFDKQLLNENETMYCAEDLLEMDIFDINFLVLPLSKDFSSWKNINNALTEPQKYMSNDMFCVYNNFTVEIEYENKPDDFILHYNLLNICCFRIANGVCSLIV